MTEGLCRKSLLLWMLAHSIADERLLARVLKGVRSNACKWCISTIGGTMNSYWKHLVCLVGLATLVFSPSLLAKETAPSAQHSLTAAEAFVALHEGTESERAALETLSQSGLLGKLRAVRNRAQDSFHHGGGAKKHYPGAISSELASVFEEAISRLRRMSTNGALRFCNHRAKERYRQTLSELDAGLTELQQCCGGGYGGGHSGGPGGGYGGGHGMDDYRGEAVMYVREHAMQSAAREMIARFPRFISRDDYVFIKAAVDGAMGSHLDDIAAAYYENPPELNPRNCKGAAAAIIANEVSSSDIARAVAALPSMVYERQLSSVRHIVDDAISSKVAGRLREYFGSY